MKQTGKRPSGKRRRWFSVLLPILLYSTAVAQVDSTEVTDDIRVRLPEGHSPRGALLRSLAIPGWGQFYNRHYFKVPIVYAGMGGLFGTAVYMNRRYKLYRHAYLYIVRENEDGSPVFPEYREDHDKLLEELGFPPESSLSDTEIESRRSRLAPGFRSNRDKLRRNRDLLFIGVGLFYGLTVLDAYVSAHLLDFDISEDLTVSLFPLPRGVGATVRFGR